MYAGQSKTVYADVRPDNATDGTVTMVSGDESKVTVTPSGAVAAAPWLGQAWTIKADKPTSGPVTMTASAAGLSDKTFLVNVLPVPVISVTGITLNETVLNDEHLSLDTDDWRGTFKLIATISPSNATDQTVTWSSSPSSGSVRVDADGTVHGTGMGPVTITATANDGSGKTATCTVTVYKAYVITQNGAATTPGTHTFAGAMSDIGTTGGYYSLRINGGGSGVTATGTSMTVGANATVSVRKHTFADTGSLQSGRLDVNGGTLILRDAELQGKSGATASVVTVNSGEFIMEGGKIFGNTNASNNGGGVRVSGTFTMTGGSITGNTAIRGGGVFVGSGRTFTKTGGGISGNTISGSGGTQVRDQSSNPAKNRNTDADGTTNLDSSTTTNWEP
jgi:hypothetical protein